MEKAKITIEGFEIMQRKGEKLCKGETLNAGEDLCFVLLPVEYSQKNIVCILAEEA